VDTLDDAVGHRAAAVEGGTEIEGHLPAHPEDRRLVVEDVRQFGVAQQCL